MAKNDETYDKRDRVVAVQAPMSTLDRQRAQAQALAKMTYEDLERAQAGEVVEALPGGMAVHDLTEDLSTFPILRDGDRLCGVPFFIVAAREHASSFGPRPYFTLWVICKGGAKYIYNDGSYPGLAASVLEARESGRTGWLWVPRGLRKSEYPVKARRPDRTPMTVIEDGEERQLYLARDANDPPTTDTSKCKWGKTYHVDTTVMA